MYVHYNKSQVILHVMYHTKLLDMLICQCYDVIIIRLYYYHFDTLELPQLPQHTTTVNQQLQCAVVSSPNKAADKVNKSFTEFSTLLYMYNFFTKDHRHYLPPRHYP